MGKIETAIANKQNNLKIDRPQLRRTVSHVLKAQDLTDACVSVVIVDDTLMSELNERFHDVAGPTDVLSFDLADTPSENAQAALDCEIVINADRALQVAAAADGQPLAELHLYLVHGLLHQLGYDDNAAAPARRIHAREDELLQALGLGAVFTNHR